MAVRPNGHVINFLEEINNMDVDMWVMCSAWNMDDVVMGMWCGGMWWCVVW